MSMPKASLLLALIIAGGAAADYESALRDAGSLGAIRLAGSDDPNVRKTYIVQLEAPSAAEYHAAIAIPTVAKAAAPRVRFDKSAPAIESYAAQLAARQDEVIAKAGPGTELIYRYQYGLNGFAARMHPTQAHKLENLPDVLRVWEDEIRPLATNYSLEFLGLFDRQGGLRGKGLAGEDVIIGVIDSGIYPEHPALADTREADRPRACTGDWAENTLLGRWLCHR